jgi:hypothetical protein
MTQRWIKLDGSYHEFSHTPATGLRLWVEVINDVGDVDGQPMTYVFDAFAVDVWYLR